jgi:hypothetical protein
MGRVFQFVELDKYNNASWIMGVGALSSGLYKKCRNTTICCVRSLVGRGVALGTDIVSIYPSLALC